MKEGVEEGDVSMVCFEVSVNGQTVCTAGVGEVGLLSLMLYWQQESRKQAEARGDEWQPGETELIVHGLAGICEHVDWITESNSPRIKVGDEVTIKVIDCDVPDTAIAKYGNTDPEIASQHKLKLCA